MAISCRCIIPVRRTGFVSRGKEILVILSERSESKNLRIMGTAKYIFGARILRLLLVAQDDNTVLIWGIHFSRFSINRSRKSKSANSTSSIFSPARRCSQ